MFEIEDNRLFGRRKYFLGTSIPSFKGWNVLKICDNLFLTYHPDLNIEYVKTDSCMFVLLGIILDPFNPEFTDKKILLNLSTSKSFEKLLEDSNNLGGRWILIYHDNYQTNIFHDAAGNREIFYCKEKENVWCASQPHFIAKYLNINKTQDKEALDFMSSDKYIKSEHAWIGNGTFFEGIYHLLPNHYLDIKTGKAKRYWPGKYFRMKNISVDEAVEISSEILKGMMKSASLRFPIALAVTAGWDSRVLLAASKEIKDEIYYFIQETPWNKGMSDIKIPKIMLKKLNLEFHIEYCVNKIEDPEFNKFFYENVAIIQTEFKKILHYNFYKRFQGMVSISGNVSEICRNFYGNSEKDLTPELLAQYFGRKGNKYAIREINNWLLQVAEPAKISNVSILDLFYWEQRMGNWGAMFSSDLDIAIEVVYPFNCRTLLTTLLSVDKNYRLKKENILYKKLIKNMWDEVLNEPINPIILEDLIRYGINKIRIKTTQIGIKR